MQIYIAEGAQQLGPFDLDAIKNGLRTGRYDPAQLAWYEGAPDWGPISRLPGLETFVVPPPSYPPASNPYPEMPPAPFNPPQTYPVPYHPGVPAPGPAGGGKRRRAWLVVGGILLGLAALTDGIIQLNHGLHPNGTPGVSSPPPGSLPAAPGVELSPLPTGAPVAGTRRFASEPAVYSGNLAEHYVGFSFDYPEDWTLQTNVQDCYVVVQHPLRLPNGNTAPAESFAVSYAYSKPGYSLASNLGAVGPTMLGMFTAPLTKNSPEAEQVPPRSGHLGKYAAEETLVTNHLGPDKVGIYYRCAIVPQQNNSNDGLGITLVSSDAAGCRSAESVGEEGGLRTIRDSFRFGP